LYWGDPNDCAKSLKKAQEMAKKYNAERGIDEKAAMDILISSMRASNVAKKAKR